MFIKVKRFNMDCLINVNKIDAVFPDNDGETTGIKSEGHNYTWAIPFAQAQDALIDCAAQVTAPIASRVMGLDNTIARLSRSVEDLLEKFNTPIINLDNMTPEERETFQDNLVAARRALRTTIQPASQTGLDSDVFAVVTMLKNGEYGEHWAGTELGGRLETEITKLVGSENEKANRLRRAEELLAEVWHEWNNDDATRKALGDDMGNVIGSFLYPDRTNC